MMDLDSAIQHCEEVAYQKDLESGFETDNERYAMTDKERADCKKCADEHRQLAEWLKELKTSRECIERIRIACLCPGLRGDGFEEEVVEAMNEYLYDMGKEWEE